MLQTAGFTNTMYHQHCPLKEPSQNMVIRVLTATAAACVKNPTRLNLNSPLLANATPQEIMNTMTANRLLGSCIRNVHEIKRMATGVNALSI